MQSLPRESAVAKEQERSVESYYQYRLSHLAWAGVFVDGPTSVRTPLHLRLAGREMLKRADRDDHLMILLLSFVFYTRSDLLHFLDYARSGDLVLHFVDENVMIAGEGVAAMLRALDRVADEPRRRAIRQTLNERRKRGLPPNGEAPIGFKLDGKGDNQQLVPDEKEQAVMKRIYELRHPGLPFSEIRLFLRKEGIRFRRKLRGKSEEREWSESRIRRGIKHG